MADRALDDMDAQLSEARARLSEVIVARREDTKIHRAELRDMIQRCRRAEQAIADYRGVHLADIHDEMRAEGPDAAPRISRDPLLALTTTALRLARDSLQSSSETFRDQVSCAIASLLGEASSTDTSEIDGSGASRRLAEIRSAAARRRSTTR